MLVGGLETSYYCWISFWRKHRYCNGYMPTFIGGLKGKTFWLFFLFIYLYSYLEHNNSSSSTKIIKVFFFYLRLNLSGGKSAGLLSVRCQLPSMDLFLTLKYYLHGWKKAHHWNFSINYHARFFFSFKRRIQGLPLEDLYFAAHRQFYFSSDILVHLCCKYYLYK